MGLGGLGSRVQGYLQRGPEEVVTRISLLILVPSPILVISGPHVKVLGLLNPEGPWGLGFRVSGCICSVDLSTYIGTTPRPVDTLATGVGVQVVGIPRMSCLFSH